MTKWRMEGCRDVVGKMSPRPVVVWNNSLCVCVLLLSVYRLICVLNRWSDVSGEGIWTSLKEGKKRWRRGEEQRRGLRKSYLWYSVRMFNLTAVRVSAAELALFHTGAISSSLCYCPPATRGHLREDKGLFSVCVCAKMSVCELFQTIPSQPTSSPSPPSSAVCVHDCPPGERFSGESSQVCFL